MIVELSDFRCDFSNLPPLEAVSRIEDGPMLLLKLPQLRVDVERPAEVSLKKFQIEKRDRNTNRIQRLKTHLLIFKMLTRRPPG